MPAIKRRSGERDDDDDSIEERGNQTRSRLSNDDESRARTNRQREQVLAPRRDEPVGDDEKEQSEDEIDSSEQDELMTQLGNQAQLDDDERASTNEEDADVLNALNDELSQLRDGTGSTASMGVLERVQMTNFMCHDKLAITLGPKLNFIVGHNGSGKSAILTAITMALGAKASATSRATAAKSFVKSGKNAALLEVWMKNMGPEAFRHDRYGDRIVIERLIRVDGSGHWRLKSKAGETISSKREELTAICDHANIQVDNPLNVLTQDTARQFLSAAKPEEMYDLFLRGTQLSQLANEYEITRNNIRRIEEQLLNKQEAHQELKEKVESFRSRLEILQRAVNQRSELEKLQTEKAWTHVADQEEKSEKALIKSERVKKALEDLNAKVATYDQDIDNAEAQITNLEEEIKELVEKEDPLKEQELQLRDQIRHHNEEMRMIEQDHDSCNRQYQLIKTQIRDTEKRIDEENVRDSHAADSKRKLLRERKEEAIDERKRLEEEEASIRDRMQDIDREAAQVDERNRHLQSQREDCRVRVGSLESTILKLRSAQQNHLSAYSQNMPRLVEAVRRQRWRGQVKGPIGSHIKLKDPQWAQILESVIGNSLSAFCVTDSQDRSVLLELKRKYHCEDVSVLTGSDELFDYSGGEPSEDILTVLRVLDIDDEFIKRQLIVATNIERAALVERRVDGDRLMRQQPRNVKTCYTKDLFRVQYGEAGASTQTMQRYTGAPRLSTDTEAMLTDYSTQLERMQQKLHEIMEELGKSGSQASQLRREREEGRRRLPVLQKEAREKYAEAERITEQLQEAEPRNLQAFYQTLKELQEEQERVKLDFQNQNHKKEEVIAQAAPIKHRKEIVSRERKIVSVEITELKSRMASAAQDRYDRQDKKNQITAQMARAVEKVKDAEQLVFQLKREHKEWSDKAREIGDFVHATRSVADIDKEIVRIERQIEQAARQQGTDIEAITQEYRRAFEAFQKAKSDTKAFNKTKKLLIESLHVRQQRWMDFRRSISLRAKNLFGYFLDQRGYSGDLIFDHRVGLLQLKVWTEASSKKRDAGDLRNLSGGEKSYSTICLLLALWQAIGCPIRCLDEFDVFMDAVNRRWSMQLILKAARGSVDTQFVLITPQSISQISPGPDVRIHRLHDPERNQTLLVPSES